MIDQGQWPTAAECARRLTIHPDEVVRLIRLPDSDPRHLSGVLVRACGVAPSERGWRVHPEVFEQYLSANCSPTPPPVDAMSTEELIEFLAGERISSKTGPYRWWRERVHEAVAFDTLTDYLVIGRARWSPAEAAAVKDALDGIKLRGRGRGGEARHALAAMMGLADIAEAMRIRGVTRGTAEGWGGQGDRPVRFGAVKIGREVFFDREQLEVPGRRASPGQAIVRKERKVKRAPSQIARLQEGHDAWVSARESAVSGLGLVTVSQVPDKLPREVRRAPFTIRRHLMMGGLAPAPNDLGLLLFSDDAIARYVEWSKQYSDGRLQRFNPTTPERAQFRGRWYRARWKSDAEFGRLASIIAGARGRKPGRKREVSDGEVRLVRELQRRGKSQRAIAITVGITYKQVRGILATP